MTGDSFDREAAAVSERWARRMRSMGYLHAAVELDDAAARLITPDHEPTAQPDDFDTTTSADTTLAGMTSADATLADTANPGSQLADDLPDAACA
jgi:hypothetical protein